MSMVNLRNKQKIERLFLSFKEEGLMSHAFGAWGFLDDRSNVQKVGYLPDDRMIFDLASLTKAIVISPLIFREFRDHQIPLSSTIDEWMGEQYPQRLDPRFKLLRVDQILGHQAGIPAWANFWSHQWLPTGQKLISREIPALNFYALHIKVLNRLAQFQWKSNKFIQDLYSDIGFILVGMLLAIKNKKSLRPLFQDFLNAECSGLPTPEYLDYTPTIRDRIRCIPTGYCPLRGRLLVGEVHDENCAVLGGETGHAGLFGTGEAVISFLQTLHSSSLGKDFLRENFIRALSKDTSNDPMIGWRRDDNLFFKKNLAIGHLGFTGCAFWVLPENGFFAVLLTNRVLMGRLNPRIKVFRSLFFDQVSTCI